MSDNRKILKVQSIFIDPQTTHIERVCNAKNITPPELIRQALEYMLEMQDYGWPSDEKASDSTTR